VVQQERCSKVEAREGSTERVGSTKGIETAVHFAATVAALIAFLGKLEVRFIRIKARGISLTRLL
jgi:hypothetical protein